MPRYRLLIEYDGTHFSGWQRQENGPSVQGAIEAAIAAFTAEDVKIRGAGRTDAGVHARGQVAHVDIVKDWRTDTVRDATNAHLRGAGVVILAADKVEDDFDARFSATARSYEYLILDRRTPPALDRGRVWHVPVRLDHEAMHQAAKVLLGRHDFTTFRASECQANSPVRTLDRLDVSREGEMVVVRAKARSFLHNQVRSMVGSLKLVGEGKWTAKDLRAALEAADRKACGPTAPAAGLCFMSVDYPEK
ncbi:tRNA pseudouridine synthase A [Agaricicola taiwanensis]|uniref:tRNA pseudouridine synthase A n=1 Tax=Agaricicola taiwanensis TaxID=591372 RepID=A0A8J2YG42_9RHOB|nr:tRNA pseudouridine(38-40) synthase TruA [Agaricicola taiwanensis]GGE33421.1 tRNA pseudouridine synthase A [Agaricicola taiwanensis]